MQRWLRQNVGAYDEGERVHADVEAALARFPALRPRADVYTYDDGRAQLLLCLDGVLPISFRGSSYNIPVALWITREYPRRAPICYVVPTHDMLVRPSRHVDLSGRCTLSYTLDWERKPEGCSIAGLLQALQEHFSRAPPLYAKPRSTGPGPSASDRPPLPPKPVASHTPPLPPRPAPASPTPTRSEAGVPSSSPRVPRPPSHGQTLPPPLPHNPHPSDAPANYRSSTSPPCPTVQSPSPLAHQPRPNLLEDDCPPPQPPAPAPPRPPNPELLHLHAQVHDKIRSEFSALSQLMLLETDRLRAQQSDLLAGEPAIRDEMARLEAVRDVCRNVAARSQSSVAQAERNLADLHRRGDPEVDELLCSTSIVHNQLINLVAEDNAIEDTIYHLHRALNAGRIDLERFLRTTRVLAEEQFMKRALTEKIQAGMPMGIGSPYS